MLLKIVLRFLYVKEKIFELRLFLFVCLFRFMRISGEGGNYELFIRVSHQISPVILSEFKQIN